MSVYCRPVLVAELDEGETRIVCMCRREFVLPAPQARRAYYEHNPKSHPIPMPHTHYEPAPTTMPPSYREVQAMQKALAEHRRQRRPRDPEDAQISRCPSCGAQVWQGVCTVRGCRANMHRHVQGAVA